MQRLKLLAASSLVAAISIVPSIGFANDKLVDMQKNPNDWVMPLGNYASTRYSKLDQINNYTVRVKFAEELETEIKVWVAPDADSKAAIDAARKARETEPAPASNFERNA